MGHSRHRFRVWPSPLPPEVNEPGGQSKHDSALFQEALGRQTAMAEAAALKAQQEDEMDSRASSPRPKSASSYAGPWRPVETFTAFGSTRRYPPGSEDTRFVPGTQPAHAIVHMIEREDIQRAQSPSPRSQTTWLDGAPTATRQDLDEKEGGFEEEDDQTLYSMEHRRTYERSSDRKTIDHRDYSQTRRQQQQQQDQETRRPLENFSMRWQNSPKPNIWV